MRRQSGIVKSILIAIMMTVTLLILGCNTLTIPSPGDIIKKPLGTESIKIGMTRDRVESIWGKPDHITIVEDTKKWPSPRQVWTYNARYGAIPVDAGYLSKTQKLYFDGENLTEISE